MAIRMVIVEAWDTRKDKRLKRYSEFFYGSHVSGMKPDEKKAYALVEITRKFSRCYGSNVEFRLYKGNQ